MIITHNLITLLLVVTYSRCDLCLVLLFFICYVSLLVMCSAEVVILGLNHLLVHIFRRSKQCNLFVAISFPFPVRALTVHKDCIFMTCVIITKDCFVC